MDAVDATPPTHTNPKYIMVYPYIPIFLKECLVYFSAQPRCILSWRNLLVVQARSSPVAIGQQLERQLICDVELCAPCRTRRSSTDLSAPGKV